MDYNKVYKKYYKISLWLIAALYLIGMLVVQCVMRSSYFHMLTISAVFSLLTASIYGGAWKAIAIQSPAASALRMLLAFLVILVYALVVKNRQEIISFAVIFMIFYLVLLAFDTIYFARLEKNNKIKN